MKKFFQDSLLGNNCYGCGAWNKKGLRIKSFWDGNETVCVFTPQAHHAAMPPDVMNGGTISALIDCHCVCSSIADAYRYEDREIGEGELIWYATASLSIQLKKPTPIDGPVTIRAKQIERKPKTTLFYADFFSHKGDLTCTGEVLSVRVSKKWSDPNGFFY